MHWSWLIALKFANFANWICRLLRLSRRMLGLLVVLYRILTICKWRWSHSSKSITLKLMHVLVQPRLSYDHFTGPIIIFFLRDYHRVSWVHGTTCSNSIIGLDQVSDLYVIIQQIDTLPCDRNEVLRFWLLLPVAGRRQMRLQSPEQEAASRHRSRSSVMLLYLIHVGQLN